MDFDYDSDPASADWDRKVYMTLGNQDDNQVVIDDTFVTAEEDNERMDLYWRLFNLFPTTITTKGNTTVYEGYYMEAGKKVSCSFTVDEEEHKLK